MHATYMITRIIQNTKLLIYKVIYKKI